MKHWYLYLFAWKWIRCNMLVHRFALYCKKMINFFFIIRYLKFFVKFGELIRRLCTFDLKEKCPRESTRVLFSYLLVSTSWSLSNVMVAWWGIFRVLKNFSKSCFLLQCVFAVLVYFLHIERSSREARQLLLTALSLRASMSKSE